MANDALEWLGPIQPLPDGLVRAYSDAGDGNDAWQRRLVENPRRDKGDVRALGIEPIIEQLSKEPDRVNNLNRAREFVEKVGKRPGASFQAKINSFALLRNDEIELLRQGFVPLEAETSEEERTTRRLQDATDEIGGERFVSDDDYLFNANSLVDGYRLNYAYHDEDGGLLGVKSKSQGRKLVSMLHQAQDEGEEYLVNVAEGANSKEQTNENRNLQEPDDADMDPSTFGVGEDDYMFGSHSDIEGYRLNYQYKDELPVKTKVQALAKKVSEPRLLEEIIPTQANSTLERLPRSRDATYHRKLEAENVDWTLYLPDVKFQGFSCGGCWAFALTGLLEGHFNINASTHGLRISLSEQNVLDCDRERNRGCLGGNYYHSLRGGFVSNQGLYLGRDVPFSFRGVSSSCPVTNLHPALKLPIDSDRFVDKSEEALMEALRRGPVAVALSSYNPTFQYYSSGILDDATGCGTRLDHAALLVGFGYDPVLQKSYWLVRNSWGNAWGENGYIRLLRGDAKVLEATGGLGMCGILAQANTLTVAPYLVEPPRPEAYLKDPRFCTAEYGCIGSNETLLGGIPKPGDLDNPLTDPANRVAVIISAVLAVVALFGIAVAALWLRRERRRTHSEELLRKSRGSWPFWPGSKPTEDDAASVASAPGQNRVAESNDESFNSQFREMSFSPRHMAGDNSNGLARSAFDVPGSSSPMRSPLALFRKDKVARETPEMDGGDDPESPTRSPTKSPTRAYSPSQHLRNSSRRLFDASTEQSDPESPPPSPERRSSSPIRMYNTSPLRSPVRPSPLRTAYPPGGVDFASD